MSLTNILTKIIFAISIPLTVFADSEWETLISCDNGKFLVETDCNGYRGAPCYFQRTQMVIRNAEVQNHFAAVRAYGYYAHPGIFEGFNSDRVPEMLVSIDRFYSWGMSGEFNYSLTIPYHDSRVKISYYINYSGPKSVTVKAVANSDSPYDIIKAGDLGSWTYHDCWIRR